MNVNAFDAAAALAGVEHGAVDEVFDGVGEVGVFANIRGIFAAEFEIHADEHAVGGGLHFAAALDGAGEGDEVDAAGADDFLDRGVAGVEDVEDAIGQAGILESIGQTFGAEGRLGGVLEDDGVAGEQRRDDGVDRG